MRFKLEGKDTIVITREVECLHMYSSRDTDLDAILRKNHSVTKIVVRDEGSARSRSDLGIPMALQKPSLHYAERSGIEVLVDVLKDSNVTSLDCSNLEGDIDFNSLSVVLSNNHNIRILNLPDDGVSRTSASVLKSNFPKLDITLDNRSFKTPPLEIKVSGPPNEDAPVASSVSTENTVLAGDSPHYSSDEE